MPKEAVFPRRVDIMPTARCNDRCKFCWGPNRSIKDGLTTDQWFVLIASLVNQGLTDLCCTGGEPLLRQDTGLLMLVARALGLNVTLSTNCSFLKDQLRLTTNVLKYINEIGIPIDGSSALVNGLLRTDDPKQFDKALQSLEMVRADYPQVHTTVRTVVTLQNQDDILNIGQVLTTHRPHRWKLYEFTPLGYGQVNQARMEIPRDRFEQIVRACEAKFPDLNIEPQFSSRQSEKYLFVGPNGDFYAIAEDLHHVLFGNPIQIGSGVIDNILKYISSRDS